MVKNKKKEVKETATVKRNVQLKPEAKPTTRTYHYTVEAGIIIAGVRHSSVDIPFPFELMKPGDSFLIPPSDPVSKSPNRLHYAAKAYAKMKPGFVITSRMQLDKSRRVWRLK